MVVAAAFEIKGIYLEGVPVRRLQGDNASTLSLNLQDKNLRGVQKLVRLHLHRSKTSLDQAKAFRLFPVHLKGAQ